MDEYFGLQFELNNLEFDLMVNLEHENYEKCSELRDRINEINITINKNKTQCSTTTKI